MRMILIISKRGDLTSFEKRLRDAVCNALIDQSVFKQRPEETEVIIRGEYAWIQPVWYWQSEGIL